MQILWRRSQFEGVFLPPLRTSDAKDTGSASCPGLRHDDRRPCDSFCDGGSNWLVQIKQARAAAPSGAGARSGARAAQSARQRGTRVPRPHARLLAANQAMLALKREIEMQVKIYTRVDSDCCKHFIAVEPGRQPPESGWRFRENASLDNSYNWKQLRGDGFLLLNN